MDDTSFRIPDDLISKENPDELEELTASFGDEIPKTRRFSEKDWNDLQKARLEYLKEWEEDMRYAQELASEGM